MTNSRLIYCYDPSGKSEPYFMTLDALKNTNGQSHHQMRPTPFAFHYLKLNEKLSFFVQSFFINNIQYTRIIVVDAATQKPISTLNDLEKDTNCYCEIGALTEFVGTDATNFYYIDPTTFNNDQFFVSNTALKLYAEAYRDKNQLFIEVLTEYKNLYIEHELYAQQILCDWINWSIKNITNLGACIPISECPSINNSDVVTVNTGIVNEHDSSDKVVTYASVTATVPSRAESSKKASMIKPTVSNRIVPKIIETSALPSPPAILANTHIKNIIKTSVFGPIASNTIEMAALKSHKAIKNLTNTRIQKKQETVARTVKYGNSTNNNKTNSSMPSSQSPFRNVQDTYKRFSFTSALLEISSSGDESDADKQELNSSKPEVNRTILITHSKQNSDNEEDEDEDTMLNRSCALAENTQQDSKEHLLKNQPNADIVTASKETAEKKAREEALQTVVLASMFLIVTPKILSTLGNIINTIDNQVKLNNSNDTSTKVQLLVFYMICASQIFCAFYAAKVLKIGAKQYVKNQPVLNSMLFGYAASKQNNVNNIAAIKDNVVIIENQTEEPKVKRSARKSRKH